MTFVPVEELSEVLRHALGKRIISPVPMGEERSESNNVVPMRRNGVAKPRRVVNGKRRVAVRKR